MTVHRCPESIQSMFDHRAGLAKARQAAVDWLKQQDVRIGDTVFMPHPETGELISYVKEGGAA